MNTGNIIIQAMDDSSVEEPCEVYDCPICQCQSNINEQSGSSRSTGTAPDTNVIDTFEPVTEDTFEPVTEDTFEPVTEDTFEPVTEFTEPCISGQNKSNSAHLDIKEACKILSNDLYLLTSADEKVIGTLKSLIKFYVQIFVEEKAKLQLLELEGTFATISRHDLLLLSHDIYIGDALEKLILSTEQFIAEKINLKSLFVEIRALLDTMVKRLPYYE